MVIEQYKNTKNEESNTDLLLFFLIELSHIPREAGNLQQSIPPPGFLTRFFFFSYKFAIYSIFLRINFLKGHVCI
jgi:hypothetical protein